MTKLVSDRAKQLRNEAILRRLELGFAPAVRNAKNASIKACADAAEHEGARHFDGELITHHVVIAQMLDQNARVVIPRFSALTYSDLAEMGSKGRRLELLHRPDRPV